MISAISPAKTLDFSSDLQIGSSEPPIFLAEAEKVNHKLRSLSAEKLMSIQSISENLAEQNYLRNQEWSAEKIMTGRQAVLAFKGDVYLGLEAENWSEEDMFFAQEKLYILSGLYGLLKPQTSILPYRLEMGTAITLGRKKNLYEFWQKSIADYFKEHIPSDEPIVNLASKEYFKALQSAKIPNPILNLEFKDYSNGKYKIVSFFAKKARGIMANFIIQNRINSTDVLKEFNLAGYYLDEAGSDDTNLVFLRDKQ
ncbi:MAG: peroxide stress protein YaaA [Bacteroidetes bacterium]|nr:MAG: peroxide stress protein YaaA [Bacteroidota bacterium]